MTKQRRRRDTPSRAVPSASVRHPARSTNGDAVTGLAPEVAALFAKLDSSARPPTPVVPPRPPQTLTLPPRPPGVSPAMAGAQLRIRGLVHNVQLIEDYSAPLYGAAEDLGATLAALEDTVAAVQRGELGQAEALLMAQAVTLNTIFARCAVQASRNLEGRLLEGTERYLRLALKAQSQCRTTIETLAILKNPTTIFARQANIAQGPQQVNNTQVNSVPNEPRVTEPATGRTTVDRDRCPPPSGHASRARTGKSGPNKLLPS